MKYFTKELIRSAESGERDSLELLAECYFLGVETDVSYYQALVYWTRASALGSGSAAFNLAVCYAKINSLPNIGKAQKAINKIEIPELLDKAKESGIGEAFLCDGYSDDALETELLNIGIIGKIGKKPSGGGFFSKL